MTPAPDPPKAESAPDSLRDLAEAYAAKWRPIMMPIARHLAGFIKARKSLGEARDQLPGLLPKLALASFLSVAESANLQARLVGLAGLPIHDQEAGSAAFADDGRVELKPLTDVEAVRYLTSKQVGGRFSFDWRDVRDEEHVSSFVVAKAMNASLLGDIHQALTTALTQGWSRDRFITELTPTLQKAGWWGEQEMTDPVTGERQLVQLGSPRRLRTIFDVNIRSAHAAGRWERFARIAQPGDMLRYTAVLDERTREQHRLWHGTTLPIDHPFWADHYPPCGWNCRCTAVLVTKAQMSRAGFTATSTEELEDEGYGETKAWLNRRTGEIEGVPIGIDPGFAFNVGRARLAAFTPQEDAAGVIGGRTTLTPQQSVLADLPEPRPFDGQLLADDADQAAQLAALQRPFRGLLQSAGPGSEVFIDKAQVPLTIDGDLLSSRSNLAKGSKRGRAAYLPVLAQTVADPDEIWVNLEQITDPAGRVVATVLRRRYVGRWILPGRQEAMLAVFQEDGDSWTGVTAFPPGLPRSPAQQLKQLDRARTGVLVWRRVR